MDVFVQFSEQFVRWFLGGVKRLNEWQFARFEAHVLKERVLASLRRLIRDGRVPVIRVLLADFRRLGFFFKVMGRHARFFLFHFARDVTRCFVRFALCHA